MKFMLTDRNRGKWYQQRKWQLSGVGVLTLIAVCVLLLFTVQKTSAATTPQNTYAIAFSTGASAMELSQLQYIAVDYTDTAGVKRTEYLTADKIPAKSNAIVEAAGTQNALRSRIQNAMGYDLSYNSDDRFAEYTVKTILFSPEYTVSTVDGVQFLTKKSGKWTCEGLRVYKVNQLYGRKGNSYVSADNYVNFSGTLLLTTESGAKTLNWTEFQLIRFGQSSNSAVKMVAVNQNYDSRTDSDYLICLDIADEYRAGFESLAAEYQDGRTGLNGLQEAEMLKLRIVYRDIYGARRMVSVPVISNVIGYALDNGVDPGDGSALLGLAGQGETIAMKVSLPDFAEFYTGADKSGNTSGAAIYLSCGGDNLLDGTGLTLKTSGRTSQRIDRAKSMSDALTLNSVRMYNISEATDAAKGYSIAAASLRVEDGLLRVDVQGTPCFYHMTSSVQGDVISYTGNEVSLTMNPYQGDISFEKSQSYENQYLIELHTDDTSLAATQSDLSVEFSYMDLSNVSRVTDSYNVKELVNEYYGYWPSNGSDYGYLQGAAQGGVLRFVITLTNVDYFTGIRVSVDGGDEWQLAGMDIYALRSLETRKGSFQDSNAGAVQSHVVYDRAFEGVKAYGIVNMQMLVENNSSKEFSFTSDKILELDVTDWSNKRYAMSYADACTNLGLNLSKYNYTVEVNVASDAQSTYSDGDSGSRNQFFFRLQFENGSSGYVLANQQITSDGFRAGQTETFTISTNQDYGDVTAVQIIPETKNSEDYTYDKLNIDSIRVIQNSTTSMSKTWTISSVGWIGADYKDPGRENGLRSQQGKYEAELAKTFKVDYMTNVANLLFCLSTGSYKDNEGNPVEQYQGRVDVTLQYVSTTGENRTATYDIVKYMYDYMGKTVPKNENGEDSGAVSDVNYMFREGHMDRFILPVSDIESLTRVDFYPTSSNGTTWEIGSLSVSEIAEQGSRYINENNEYIYTGETRLLCSNAEEINAMVCPKGVRQEGVKVNMTENKLLMDAESTQWVSVVSREPISTRDMLNVYLYMKDDAVDKSYYDLTATVEYTNVRGLVARSGERRMNQSDNPEENMFYLMGLEVKEMSTLNQLVIRNVSDQAYYTPINYAVVQRVRSGVIIDTYYIYFGGADPGSSNTAVKAGPSGASQSTGEYQVVTLDFGGSTQNIQLLPENRDVAVAIRYISSAGNLGTSQTEYNSPYIFLTDQQYYTLYNGQSVDITFHEKYVSRITGITIVPSGQVQADITGAVAATYQETDTQADPTIDPVPTGWYSFPGQRHMEVRAGSNIGSLILSDPVIATDKERLNDVVTPVTMTIKTAGAAREYESGTSTPIRMNLYYVRADGQSETYTVQDITKVCTTGSSFATDGTATLKFMLTGVKALKSVTFEPYDDDENNIAAWTPETLTIQRRTASGTDTMIRQIGKRIYEGHAEDSRVLLTNMVISATVAVKKDGASEYSQTYDTMIQDVNLLIETPETLRILPQLTGSEQGFDYRLEKIDSSGTAMAEIPLTSDHGISMDERNYMLIDTTKLTAGSYRLTIYSRENQAYSTVVKFVKSADVTVSDGNGNAGGTANVNGNAGGTVAADDNATAKADNGN